MRIEIWKKQRQADEHFEKFVNMQQSGPNAGKLKIDLDKRAVELPCAPGTVWFIAGNNLADKLKDKKNLISHINFNVMPSNVQIRTARWFTLQKITVCGEDAFKFLTEDK